MNRKHVIPVLLTLFVFLFTASDALARKKKKGASTDSAPSGEITSDSVPTTPTPTKKKRAVDEVAPEDAATGDKPSKVMDRALKLYDSEDFYSASIELNKVVEGESGDTEAVKQKAEFWMGKTLYNIKFYSASLSYFDRIVQKGAAHAYYNATLKWLASLSRQLPDSTGILEKIGKYNKEALDDPALEKVRDELRFLLGKFYYSKAQFKEAVELFNMVPDSSDIYVQAKLFEGATHVRQYQAKPAVESFKEVLRAAVRATDPKVKSFEDLANLSLARTFYSTGQFELAVKYFDKVSPDSYDWANSLFEASWANFMLKAQGYPKALGNIHTLQAPFFEDFIKPESVAEALTVKATIYFYNCLFDRAKDGINEFNAIYPDLAGNLQKLLGQNTDNNALFAVAQKIRNGTSGLDKVSERAARAVMSDRALSKRFEYVDELQRELNQHDKADAAWKATTVAQSIYADLTVQKSLAMNECGELSRGRLKRLVGEIGQLIKRVIKIEYEILEGEKSQLEQSVVQERETATGPSVRRASVIRIDDEHYYWPFTGEYWRDELGYYRFKIENRCGQKGAPESAPSTTAPAAGGEGGGEAAPAPEAAPAEAPAAPAAE